MADRMADKVAVATGAGRGVGRAVALLLTREGASVVVADNGSRVDGTGRSSEPADAVVEEIAALASPEQRPDTVAPLVVYLASPAAGFVTGWIFGSYGYRYARWSEPVHEAVLESDGPWDLSRLFEEFPRTLGEGLSPERDLRHLVADLDELRPSPRPSAPRGSVTVPQRQ